MSWTTLYCTAEDVQGYYLIHLCKLMLGVNISFRNVLDAMCGEVRFQMLRSRLYADIILIQLLTFQDITQLTAFNLVMTFWRLYSIPSLSWKSQLGPIDSATSCLWTLEPAQNGICD